MPELPEVEVMRNYFEYAALDKVIRRVYCYDSKILKGKIKLINAGLKGGVFKRTSRRGKYLFASTKNKCLVFHFGMTGDLRLCSANDDTPRFSRLAFEFNSGDYLHVTSQRKFGYVQEIKDEDAFIAAKKMGPDALSISRKEFVKTLDGPKTKLKPFLMDQKRIAGIGNWIAANKGNFPKNWFVNQRLQGGVCTRCGNEVDKKQVGGRSSYFCKKCQKH